MISANAGYSKGLQRYPCGMTGNVSNTKSRVEDIKTIWISLSPVRSRLASSSPLISPMQMSRKMIWNPPLRYAFRNASALRKRVTLTDVVRRSEK